MGSSPEPVVLITGGVGFLGRALVRELTRADGVVRPREVRVLDPRAPDGDGGGEIRYLAGDVRRPADLARACAGVDIVFHLAALIDWGQHLPEVVRAVNLDGTRNVIAACREAGTRALVFTSSLDAIYSGLAAHETDESAPYPASFPSEYCASKAEAEQAVLAADGLPLGGSSARRLRTIVIRPCSIWGENDPYHIGAMLRLARLGAVARLGRGRPPTQWVYVGNVAHLLVLAAKALWEGRQEAAGQVYFATDFPARNFFDQLEPVVRAVGGRMLPPSLALPHRPVRVLSQLVQLATRGLRPFVALTPLLTPFSVDFVCHEFTVRTDKAARLLGYRPIYSEAEAYARTIAAARGEFSPRSKVCGTV